MPERNGKLTVRVLLVDDHAVVRSGLRLLLDAEPGIEVVAEAASGHVALVENRAHRPDVVVMDLVLPDESGIEAGRRLLCETPEAKLLVLSMQDDPRYAREAFAAGAEGYVLKDAADTALVAAIRDVASGERYLDPALGARLAAMEQEEREHSEAGPLSEREREVLRLLAHGHTNQEIANMLLISVRTVETHRAHVMRRLHRRTRAELVRYAIKEGLLETAR